MMTNADNIEARLIRSFWDDGLLDLLVGFGLLAAGLAWINGVIALMPIAVPLLIALWKPLRARIVEPRAGYVRFTQERRNRTRFSLLATVAVGVGALLLVAGAAFVASRVESAPAGDWVSGLPGGLVALGIGIAGMLTGARRFYVYAASVLGITAGFSAFVDRPDAPLLLGGVLIITCGAVLLARFIRDSADLPGEAA